MSSTAGLPTCFQMADGSLLYNQNGATYRVSYGVRRPPGRQRERSETGRIE